MRPIKFRAWDQYNKNMIDDEFIDNIDFANGIVNCSSGGYNEIEWDCEIENATFMQSTGLRDKNGVEIYEGDIVQRGEYFYEVVWNEKKGWFGIDDHDYGLTVLAQHIDYINIVGNIFENHELLEVENELR